MRRKLNRLLLGLKIISRALVSGSQTWHWDNKNPLFVGGITGRTGTTWLMHCLSAASHNTHVYIKEVGFFVLSQFRYAWYEYYQVGDPREKKVHYLRFFKHFVLSYGYDRSGKIYGQGLKGLKDISPIKRPLKQMLQQLQANLKGMERPEDIKIQFGNFYLWLFNYYAGIRARKRAWISKEIGYARHADELFAMIPNAKLIIMVRDGRDAALSMFARKWAPTVRDSIDMWKTFTEMTLRALASCPADRYKLVQYEELVSDFPRVFPDILNFLGVPSPSPDIDKFLAETMAPPNPLSLGRWKKEMSKEDLAYFESVCGELMKALHYR